jgi:hypothetical protein
MDARQTDHLKAYGVTYRMLARGGRAEWLLNYRNGSFLLPDDQATVRDATLEGVILERLTDTDVMDVRGTIQANNMDTVPLEKAPKVAVYVPPNAAPWDDAVTMALEYSGIEYDKVWDPDVIAGNLSDYEWLHLHHEDFTGQFSKFYLTYSGSAWLTEMVRRNAQTANNLGFETVASLKKGVAWGIRQFVDNGGFLFGMCTATETLDVALAAEGVDVAAQYSDGTPMDPRATGLLDWGRTLAFEGAVLERSASVAAFSDIDGHQVNNPGRQVIRDFYGLTTSFNRHRLKPGVTVLADEVGAPWVKYIHGNHGLGTWTFLGGHDPEDPQHQIGDPPTDLSLYPNSPGYRLILNNVLFPAAEKRELKT